MIFTKREVPKGDGKAYIKVEAGKNVTGVLRGKVFEFYQIWPYGGEKQVFSEPVPGSSSRFKVNIVVHEGGQFVAKVWEFGLSIYNQLAEYADSVEIETTKIKISRIGEGKKTNWIVVPVIKEPLNKKQLAEIDAVELNDLVSGAEPHTPVGSFDSEMKSEETPF